MPNKERRKPKTVNIPESLLAKAESLADTPIGMRLKWDPFLVGLIRDWVETQEKGKQDE